MLCGNHADVFCARKAEDVDAELLQGRLVHFREFHFQQNFARRRRRHFHQAGDFRRGAFHDFENLVRHRLRGNFAGQHHDIFGGFDYDRLVRKHFVNLFGQAQNVNIHGYFKSLALLVFIPDDERNSARSFSVDENLRGAYDDRFGNGGIGERNSLDARRRGDDQRASHKEMQRLRNFA